MIVPAVNETRCLSGNRGSGLHGSRVESRTRLHTSTPRAWLPVRPPQPQKVIRACLLRGEHARELDDRIGIRQSRLARHAPKLPRPCCGGNQISILDGIPVVFESREADGLSLDRGRFWVVLVDPQRPTRYLEATRAMVDA
jgi:hypothetical protein